MSTKIQQSTAALKAIYLWLRERDPGLDAIRIEYSGEGDQGQIENIEGVKDEHLVLELPASLYPHRGTRYSGLERLLGAVLAEASTTLECALDELGWDLAYGAHPGFEIDDGGAGTVTIATDSNNPSLVIITLDHKEHYTESTTYCDEF